MTEKSRGEAGGDAPLALAARVASGERRALARAITLVESTRAADREAAEALLAALPRRGDALRLGLSGSPGVGKSTFIEGLGRALTANGRRVAVLAVDPSSTRSGGSILGDKTRMERLARDPAAFIRPSPSGGGLGGVARRTREAILLVEAAGFDVVMVETVGVGQSETMVAEMTDIFALLVGPGGGDDLQGVKRGIMEIADLVVVNKADGDLAPAAARTATDYAGALRLMRPKPGDPAGWPRAMTCSALAETGLAAVWEAAEALDAARAASGAKAERRRAQATGWFHYEIRQGLEAALEAHQAASALARRLEGAVRDGQTAPSAAARLVLDALLRDRAGA